MSETLEELDLLGTEGFLETLAEEAPDLFLEVTEPLFVEDPVLAEQVTTDLLEVSPALDELLSEELDPEEEDVLNDEFIDEVMPALLEEPEIREELLPIVNEELGEELGETLEELTLRFWSRARSRIRGFARRARHTFRRFKSRVVRATRHVYRRVRRARPRIARRIRGWIRRHVAIRARHYVRNKIRRSSVWNRTKGWFRRQSKRVKGWFGRVFHRRVKERPKIITPHVVHPIRPVVPPAEISTVPPVVPTTVRPGEEQAYNEIKEAVEEPKTPEEAKGIAKAFETALPKPPVAAEFTMEDMLPAPPPFPPVPRIMLKMMGIEVPEMKMPGIPTITPGGK